jgi:Zn-dependent peptidase ImmA (M78 family)
MKIPRSIKLNGVTYSIEIKQDKGYYGSCDIDTKSILLSPHKHKQALYLTLIHEIIHGLLHEHGIKADSEELEEAFVREVEKNIKRFFIAKELI